LAKLVGESAAIHAGEDGVGNEQLDAIGMSGGNCEGVSGTGGGKNTEAALAKHLFHNLAQVGLVFDQKHGRLKGSRGRTNGLRLWGLDGGFGGDREKQGEGRAAADLTLDRNMATTLFDNTVDRGKAEAGAFRAILSGKKRFEHALSSGFVDTSAAVGNGKKNIRQEGRRSGRQIERRVIVRNVCRAEKKAAAERHGIAGIDDQIHDYLFDLSRVGFDELEITFENELKIDILADQAAKKAFHFKNDGIEIENAGLQNLLEAVG